MKQDIASHFCSDNSDGFLSTFYWESQTGPLIMGVWMRIGSDSWKYLLISAAAKLGIAVDSSQAEQFALYANELILWNRKINLTSVTAPDEIALKHFVDSLAPLQFIPSAVRILDIGSGAGFPGIPMKILTPSLDMTLVDASRKRVSFQLNVIRILRLPQIKALHIRAEDLAHKAERQSCFDVIITRAVTSITHSIKLARPLLAANGTLIMLKGRAQTVRGEIQKYLNDLPQSAAPQALYPQIEKIYALPYLGDERTIVCCRNNGS